jgi:hypothetical protein
VILLDSDVLIDLLRNYPPAMVWFDALPEAVTVDSMEGLDADVVASRE